MGPADDRRPSRVVDAEIPEDDLVDGEGVGAGIDVTHLGRPPAPHDAERAVGDRRPESTTAKSGAATSSSIIVAERKSVRRPA